MSFCVGWKQLRFKILRNEVTKYLNINSGTKIIICALLLIILLAKCTAPKITLYEYPPDWKENSKRDSTINYYSKYLSGKKIFIDPGHGGEDRKNKNPKGDVIEADVNVHVACYLRDYFKQAGVDVEMSRDVDKTVPLAYRSELANKSGADLFVSIHQNAPGKTEDVFTNYTSVYYHAKETDYEYEPNERDVARYIERDLSYVMGNPGGLGSFDGTYSDYNIYPGEGFSVLRKTNIPSVLVECAFHTSHFEELRLNDETFNQIQAWGIFRGIAKYFRSGIPCIKLIPDSMKCGNGIVNISFALKDSSGIDAKSISAFINKEEKDFSFDKKTNILSVKIESTQEGTIPIKIICANKKGNHSLPFNKNVIIKGNSINIE
jgi:N-acetylmuramoyl-L-alanine amidase